MSSFDIGGTTNYHEALLTDGGMGRSGRKERRWKAATAIAFVAVGVLSMALANVASQLNSMKAQVQAQADESARKEQMATMTWARAAARHYQQPSSSAALVDVDGTPETTVDEETCTPSGHDIFQTGKMLSCCKGTVVVNSPCGGGRGGDICQYCVGAAPPEACTPAGTDVYDNHVHQALKCCPGLVQVDTPCRDGDVCQYCQPKGLGQEGCTPPGRDVFSNPTGKKWECCKGLTETTAPCRGDDECVFCIPLSYEDGPRAEQPAWVDSHAGSPGLDKEHRSAS